MEAGEGGLTRGRCVITCPLKAVAVAGLLWLSWCVFGGADFFSFLFSAFFFQAEDGIRDRSPSRGLGDVYKRQVYEIRTKSGMHAVVGQPNLRCIDHCNRVS